MEKETKKTQSIPEQIVEEMVIALRKDPNFDEQTIDNLTSLWKKGELKKAESVLKAITPASEKIK